MPTSRNSPKSAKTSVTEIKLELPAMKSTSKPMSKISVRKAAKTQYEYCAPDSKKAAVYPHLASHQTFVAVHDVVYQGGRQDQTLIKVPPGNTKVVVDEESSKSTPSPKQRGYDLTSSTNSHFEGWLLAVPKKLKGQRTSSSSQASESDASLSVKSSLERSKASAEKLLTSEELVDTLHDARAQKLNLQGPEWKQPCKGSFVAGAPPPFIGTCPHNFEALSRMARGRQKFFLTMDPRKKYCLTNPQVLRRKAFSKKKEFNTLTKMVKHADNVCAATASHSSESFVCEEIDLENPLQLDFQGMDFKNTYECDEQDTQNQRLYRRIVRYMERRRVKAETENTVEEELQRERVAVPVCFAVPNRNIEEESSTSEEPVRFGKLLRAADKPYNKERIALEQSERRNRYKDLYLRRKERAEKQEEEQKQLNKEEEERHASMLANKHFWGVLGDINDAIARSFKMERQLRRQELQRRIFPHTMRETLQFKKKLKAANRAKRDEAKVKREFYIERLGVVKDYPEANLEISSDTAKHTEASTLTEQSSDDEDNIRVGKENDVFKLRGFHFKLGDHLRGKKHQHERKEKGCITREQWLAMLAPKKEPIKVDIEEGIVKLKSPDDPNLLLFHPQYGFKPPRAGTSAVQEYVNKRLGRHYERAQHRNLKLVRPRLRYNIKKFNLIRFLYDDNIMQKLQQAKKEQQEKGQKQRQPETTLEYMQIKEDRRQQQKQLIKQKRLQLLGIPCRIMKKSRMQSLCQRSDTSSDQWVPEAEPELLDQEEENARATVAKSVQVSRRQRGNMPAPRHRETTLRRHPRKPRDYFGERVPSALFDEAVLKTGVPHMFRLPPDMINYGNMQMPKRKFTEMFEARHHHDHWNATQQKIVDVHYQATIVKPEITQDKRKEHRILMENFRMANPPCNAFVEMDLTMPRWDTNAMIADYLKDHKRKVDDTVGENVKDICRPRDFVFHSRPRKDFENLDYPGRQEYLQFLQEVRQALYEKKVVEDGEEKLTVNRDELIEELEGDLKSIELCLTSLSSSECTNLTNDSGSFLLMEGKTKIPLDYIRKSLVPFEELQRSRFNMKPIDVAAEAANPFKVLPFAGQRKAQQELAAAKDTFFTFNSRLKNGLRLRLEVPVEDVRQKLLGRGTNKFPGAVSTDIDENYVDELKNRPPIRAFNFKSGRSFIKDALRLKFESMLIQGQIVRTKIYDRLNEQHWENMQRTKTLYEKLFAKWEKREYENAMAVVRQVKSYYDITDALKREFRELERQQMILNMDIVFIEGHWIRCIMLQNFHYLLGDQEWRYEHDWIHRLPPKERNTELIEEEEVGEEEDFERLDAGTDEIELENFEESIAKRNTANIRVRDKDDAWAIKAFYENVYLQNLHPILIVFPDADSFLKGIENLKIKTFVLLLELHFTLSIHTELQGRLETFEEWCLQDLKEKEQYVSRKCAKKYFMSDRAAELKRRTIDFLEAPIDESFNDESFIKDRAVISEVFRHIVPSNMRGASDQDMEPINMVALMSEVVVELIAKFESIPMEQSRRIEARLRREGAYQRKLSQQAYQVEKRIESEMKKVRRNLEPPYQKPKRVGKLPRIIIKKKKRKTKVLEYRLSENTRFFFRAFHDEGDISQLTAHDARDSLFVVDTMQEQIVPFYFDHFLKLNGYTPNYNFKTNVEIRDGPEQNRALVRSVLPGVLDKLEKWEVLRRRVMEENISRNPKMYENVHF